jgi:hypothetical protein
MSDLPHLRLENTAETAKYSYAGPTPQGVNFDSPARTKFSHAKQIKAGFSGAAGEAQKRRTEDADAYPELLERKPEGLVLTFRGDPKHELKLDGLERRGSGIYLLGLTMDKDVQVARVFVPEGKLKEFLKLVDEYAASVVLTYEADPKNEQK